MHKFKHPDHLKSYLGLQLGFLGNLFRSTFLKVKNFPILFPFRWQIFLLTFIGYGNVQAQVPQEIFDRLERNLDSLYYNDVWYATPFSDSLQNIWINYDEEPEDVWEDFFIDYFSTRHYPSNLNDYLGYPSFTNWSTPQGNIRLQRGLYTGLSHLNTRLLASTIDENAMSDSMTNNLPFRETLRYIHEWMTRLLLSERSEVVSQGRFVPDLADSVCNSTIKLLNDYPEYFSNRDSVDHAVMPYLFSIKAQIFANLAGAAKLLPHRREAIKSAIDFSTSHPLVEAIWNDEQILIIDNHMLTGNVLQVIYDHFSNIPDTIHEAVAFRIQEPLNLSGGRWWISSTFGIPDTYIPSLVPNSVSTIFPPEAETIAIDLYSAQLPWSIANSGIWERIKFKHPEFITYLDSLIARAGTAKDNYANNQPYRGDSVYYKDPRLFFNEHYVLYYVNSYHFLDLAIERFEQNRPHALSQFLLYANMMSIGSDSTRFITVDGSAQSNVDILKVDRDVDGFITRIYLNNDCWYEFELDAAKMVTGIDIHTDVCFPPFDCEMACADLMNYPDFCALMDLFESTNGQQWTNNTGWIDGYNGTDCNYCDWYGVTCDENNRVTLLYLWSNNLNGQIPGLIGDLDQLTNLRLDNNSLYGNIPMEIGNLQKLSSLWLPGNNLSGPIPDTIYTLSNLTQLSFANNDFTDTISSEIENLPNLSIFYIDRNNFYGELPIEFYQLGKMSNISIWDNDLTGELLDSVINFQNLRAFNASHNNFYGSLPEAFGKLPLLVSLTLQNNQLTGCIPISYVNLCDTKDSPYVNDGVKLNNIGLDNGGDFNAFCENLSGACENEINCGFTKLTIFLGNNNSQLNWTFIGGGQYFNQTYADNDPLYDTLTYYYDLNEGWYSFQITNSAEGGLGTGTFEIRNVASNEVVLSNQNFDFSYRSQEFPVCGATAVHKKFLVTNTNNSGLGSLRAAMDSTWVHFGHDTIEVVTTGVIELESNGSFQLLGWFTDVTFNGNGIIIDANGLGRHAATSNSAFINNVTFRNGDATGASAGAIWIGFQATTDTVVFDCVLFENNRANWDIVGGGAFRTAANTKVKAVNCTFSGNSSAYDGGAIDLEPGSVFISEYCTFNLNRAGRHGGAIHNNLGQLHLTGTILSNSLPEGIEDIYNVGGSSGALQENPKPLAKSNSNANIPVNDYNLVERCAGDCPPFAIEGQDPVLGPLQDNGGNTFTHALLPGSPAINSDPDPNTMPDGRGYVSSTRRDIGSFEAEASLPALCQSYKYLRQAVDDGQRHQVQAALLIGAENIVSANSELILRAGTEIELKNGFSIEQGSLLELLIGLCQDLNN